MNYVRNGQRADKNSFLVATFADKFRAGMGRVIADQRKSPPFEGWGPRLAAGIDPTIR